jgi:hypothetical protein
VFIILIPGYSQHVENIRQRSGLPGVGRHLNEANPLVIEKVIIVEWLSLRKILQISSDEVTCFMDLIADIPGIIVPEKFCTFQVLKMPEQFFLTCIQGIETTKGTF